MTTPSTRPVPQHIGIVACSAPGAALCYQTICTEAEARLGRHEHPEVSLHAFSFGEHMRLLYAGDWAGVGTLLQRSTAKLAALGAAFAVCPDNTVHQALPFVAGGLAIPWLHIASAVADEARRRGFRRLGVLGTRFLMDGPVYREALGQAGIGVVVPDAAARDAVNAIIFDDLVYGRVPAAARTRLRQIATTLRDAGCDAVVLGCTELPLAVDDDVSPLPTLDSTRLLARAAIARAVDGR